jgi:hypothetical protein
LQVGVGEEKLKGREARRKIARITCAIEEGEVNGKMLIEDGDFDLIDRFLDKYQPALWGTNKDMCKAIEEIEEIGRKEEKEAK